MEHKNKEIIEYELIRSNRKSLQIQITDDARVVVKAPARMQSADIESFLLKKKHWLFKTLEAVQIQIDKNPPRQYVNGDQLMYRGRQCGLNLQVIHAGTKSTISMRDDIFYLQTPYPEDLDMKKALLEKWYRNQARYLLHERADHYAGMLGVQYAAIRIKSQKSRWGSCSAKGNLNFNWHIIMAPDDISDYVVVHELCHLLHMDHSPEFWQCVAAILPDYQESRRWLKINSTILA